MYSFSFPLEQSHTVYIVNIHYTGTFDLQSMNISTQPNGEVEIICNFLEGSNAKGCHLKVTKLNGNTTRYDVIREGQHALKIIGPYEVGNYIISGYDWESDGNFDSTQVAVSGYFKIDCEFRSSENKEVIISLDISFRW